jgi:hypothetical protein
MKNILCFAAFWLFLLVELTSCTGVRFRESQPEGVRCLETFPAELRGFYINPDGDTLIVKTVKIQLVNRRSECNRLFEEDSLGPGLQLKQMDEDFFLNILEDSLWTTIHIRTISDSMLDISLIDGEYTASIETLSGIIDLDTITTPEGERVCYVADPDIPSLLQMIHSNVFSEHYRFRRVRE